VERSDAPVVPDREPAVPAPPSAGVVRTPPPRAREKASAPDLPDLPDLPELPEPEPAAGLVTPPEEAADAERLAALEDLSSVRAVPQPPRRRVGRLLAFGFSAAVLAGGLTLGGLTLLGGAPAPERPQVAGGAEPGPAPEAPTTAAAAPAPLAVDLPTTAYGVPAPEGVPVRITRERVRVEGLDDITVGPDRPAGAPVPGLHDAVGGRPAHVLADAGVPYSLLSAAVLTLGGPDTEVLLGALPVGARASETSYQVLPVRLGEPRAPDSDEEARHKRVKARLKVKAKAGGKRRRRQIEARLPAAVQGIEACLRRHVAPPARGKHKLAIRFDAEGVPEDVSVTAGLLDGAQPVPCLAGVFSEWSLARQAPAGGADGRARMKVKTKLKVKTSKGFEPPEDGGRAARKAAKARITACLGQHLSSKAKGKVRLTVRFDGEGKRTGVEVVKDPMDGGQPTPCIVEALQAWDLGRPPAGRASKVKVAIAFKAKPRKARKRSAPKPGKPFSAKVAVAWKVAQAEEPEEPTAPPEVPAEVRIVIVEAGYRVTPPTGEPFELAKVGDYHKAPTLAQRLIDGREGLPEGVRIAIEPGADTSYRTLVDLVGALRQPVEGEPAFPPVTLRPLPGG